jgi:hypothetical protein
MGKGRRAHHKLDQPCREPLGMPNPPIRDEDTTIPQLQNTQSVVVEEYTSNNGCRMVRIGVAPRVVVGDNLPADYDLGVTVLDAEKEDDHLSQKQKEQKRSYWRWFFWR